MEKLQILLIFIINYSSVYCAPVSDSSGAADEFEDSLVGVIISPIKATKVIREIGLYWHHIKYRSGDEIGLYFEKPRDGKTPIFKTTLDSQSGQVKTGVSAEFISTSNLTFTKQCLKYHVALLRDGKVRKRNCLKTEPTWMADMRSILGRQRIRDIFLPGTHDASAYNKSQNPQPDSFLTRYFITQDENILGQLIYGARYLDIRVCRNHDKWWGCHGPILVVPLQTVIDDIKTFLNNTNEIIIFDVHEFPLGFNDLKTHWEFVNYLEKQFAEHIIPKSVDWSSTLETIWSSGRRLIIGYNNHQVSNRFKSLRPNVIHQWGNVKNVDELYKHLNIVETNALSSQVVNPRSAMAEITPSIMQIATNQVSGLRKLAEDVNVKITIWYNTRWQYSANIVSVDFIKATGIVDVALRWNKKRFNN